MVGRDITPTEIGKHSKLIKVAQDEMATMDVLVCGRCLHVFHFIEDFKEHKQKLCQKESNNVRECNDTKPKIWAFLLWKATQLNNNKDTNTVSPNSWALYQTWVKMDESLRETWIVAGKTIQSFAKVGQGGLQEMPVKITKTVVNNSGAEPATPGRKPLTQTKPQVANLKPPAKIPTTNANKTTQDSENETSPIKTTPTTLNKIIKKPVTLAGAQANKIATAAAAPVGKILSRRAKRTVPNSSEIIEENVEKIVAKRFNPRRKMHEYLVKWETRSHEQNTWEPALHLENVPHLLDTFEKQLARQKETRAAMQAKQQAASLAASVKTIDVAKITESNKKEINISVAAMTKHNLTKFDTSSDGSKTGLASPGSEVSMRPTRTSKTKAMDQVKQWVSGSGSVNSSSSAAASPTPDGSGMQETEKEWSLNSSGAMKRKFDDSDFNDSNASDLPATTATMEDLEDDLIPSHTVKRMKNGNSISVEVKTKNESKLIKVNGTASRNASAVSGESLPVGPNSAEVIITQDVNASGVVKKPGVTSNANNSHKTEAQIRVLSKGESAVSSSGIVRVGSASAAEIAETKTIAGGRTQIRVGQSQARQTNAQVATISQRQHHMVQRTPGGTTIQRKTVPVGAGQQQQRTSTTATMQVGQTRTGLTQQTSPSSGRMIIPRQSNVTTTTRQLASKNVTPEQKILQLSKSGDLKVTKKVMTREDAVAQRMNPQQRQQQQQQSQVQIQKVQQIAPPASRTSVTSVSVRKQPDGSYAHEEQHQAQLCPITGKLIGQDDSPQQQQLQSGVLQTQLVTEQQQQMALQQEQQQQLQDIDPTLLLGGDQQMLTNEDGSPLLVTGEDGTVYQVAGKNAEGQTILVTQGPDGEQQFAYVAAAEGDENQVLTLDSAVAEAVAQLPSEQQAEALAAAAAGEGQYLVKTTQEDGTTQMVTMSETELAQHQALAAQQQQQVAGAGATGTGNATAQLCINTGDGGDGQEANIPAEVVQADLPSPGGTRRVVLLLQDGTFMMTEMHDDEFKALNIAA